ncbi:hypothetical protein ILUMI_12160 [Ignelater luminosus]|uniref:BTB domain-containing protein n=1 Tax=Ignelater luminosus TaxID=2038154 RepID=A0A8K0D0T9_IGNLU|nr:hypothetical protein ILUMI_12160 [Ignelater luminosus]
MSNRNNNKAFKDDKIAHLYKTKDWADCVFLFEEQKISAHKLILTCSSPVFESMFYGSMASAEIQICDIELEDFKQMLEFVYTGNINITSVVNAWSLLYISQKYFLNDLKNICIDYINFNLTLSTLLLSYEYAQLYSLKQLSDRCWKDILLSAKELLLLDYHMQSSTFCSLLDENEINANEKDLIEAAIKWSEDECVFQNIESTKENMSRILIEARIFPRLRFACLGKGSYHYLYQLLANNSQNVSDYVSLINTKTEQRHRMPYHVKFKFRETYKIEQTLSLSERKEFDCIISAAQKIAVYGVAVTPPHQGGFSSAHSDVGISIFDKFGCLLFEMNSDIKITSDYEHPHLINFNRGIMLEALTPYRISVKYLSSNNLCKPNELLCFYLSSVIKTHANSMTICFGDQLYGGVVRGISFYVV